MMRVDTSVSAETDAMISVRDLRVNYGEREILHGIDFDVNRGETLVILGGSGSGKSTLLRTLVGLEKPTSGQIWIKGKDIAAIPASEMDEIRKKIGMSFQGGALFGSMTVGENVALPSRAPSLWTRKSYSSTSLPPASIPLSPRASTSSSWSSSTPSA